MIGLALVFQAMIVACAQTIYLFAPLLLSAAFSGFVLRFNLAPSLRAPIDAGRMVRRRRMFGDSKTWRGVVTAVVGSIIAVTIQRFFAEDVPSFLRVVDYEHVNPVCFGTAMGVGAMTGELPNSFVKRQLGISPGATAKGPWRILFYLWDQLDLLTGAWPAIAYWVHPSATLIGTSVAVTLVVHPLIALIGYAAGARATAR